MLLEGLDNTLGLGAELTVDVQRLIPECAVLSLGKGVEPGLELPDGTATGPTLDDLAR